MKNRLPPKQFEETLVVVVEVVATTVVYRDSQEEVEISPLLKKSALFASLMDLLLGPALTL